jgi:hypothetical protein
VMRVGLVVVVHILVVCGWLQVPGSAGVSEWGSEEGRANEGSGEVSEWESERVMRSSSSPVIVINSLQDKTANSTHCIPQMSGMNACNLRSALSYCSEVLSSSTAASSSSSTSSSSSSSSSEECVVAVPPSSVVEMNSTLGEINLLFNNFMNGLSVSSVVLVLDGGGSTITLDEESRAAVGRSHSRESGLLILTGDDTVQVNVLIRDVVFSHFTDSVISVDQVNVEVKDTQFVNNTAQKGNVFCQLDGCSLVLLFFI